MPRDPSGVRPQGTLTRHPADFFSDSMYTGGFALPALLAPGNDGYLAVALYNQDQQGQLVKVYGISTAQYSGGGNAANLIHGSFGSLVGPAQSIRPDYPTPNVFIFQNQVIGPGTNPPYPYTFGPVANLIGTNGFDSNTLVSPFPLFIIPVGYSLIISNLVSSDFMAFFFWFQLAAR